MTLKYSIKFLDYWHLGSGLSAGAKLDSRVVKDSDDIPFVPAKTIKGLAREIAEELYDSEFVERCFGGEGVKSGKCYFANATLDETMHKEIVSNKLEDNLYDVIASTKIYNGIAVDDSLREIEVVIPMSLNGKILDIPSEDDCEKLIKCLKLIKRMGLNRNRGLGRCEYGEIECKN